MEYTTLWQPLLLIFISFLIGAFFGALAMFWSMHTDKELLKIDADINQDRLRKCQNNLDHYLNKYMDDDYEAY